MAYTRIQRLCGSAVEWTTHDPVLMVAEAGYESQPDGTYKVKIGDGTHKWSELPYAVDYQGIADNAAAAQTAKIAAEVAQVAAEAAQTNAENAETNAETAQSASETAMADAITIKTAAETAKANAETAETNAETAETNAEAAQVAAEMARADAIIAKIAAETAAARSASSAVAAAGSASAAAASATTVLQTVINTSNALTKTLTGSAVRINDASPLIHPLSINVTGTSTQSGTPTPFAPIPIIHSSVLMASGEHAGQYATSVRVDGKNLYSGGTVEIAQYATSIFATSNSELFNAFSRLCAGNTYTISWDFDGDGTGSGAGQIRLYNGSTQLCLIIPTNRTFVAPAVSITNIGIYTRTGATYARYNNIQIELGDTATVYTPYIEPVTATIYTAEPLRKGDMWDVSGGTVTRNTGIYVFDGTEGITDYDGGLGFALTLSIMKSGNVLNGACTHVITKTSGSTTVPGTYCFLGAGNSRVYFRGLISEPDSTMALQREWLADQDTSGTPVTVEFPLATPIVLPVTAFTLNSINGIMTIKADGTVEITYNRDINIAINEILTAITALGTT